MLLSSYMLSDDSIYIKADRECTYPQEIMLPTILCEKYLTHVSELNIHTPLTCKQMEMVGCRTGIGKSCAGILGAKRDLFQVQNLGTVR